MKNRQSNKRKSANRNSKRKTNKKESKRKIIKHVIRENKQGTRGRVEGKIKTMKEIYGCMFCVTFV